MCIHRGAPAITEPGIVSGHCVTGGPMSVPSVTAPTLQPLPVIGLPSFICTVTRGRHPTPPESTCLWSTHPPSPFTQASTPCPAHSHSPNVEILEGRYKTGKGVICQIYALEKNGKDCGSSECPSVLYHFLALSDVNDFYFRI